MATILFVGSDLQARVRVEQAARAAGAELAVIGAGSRLPPGASLAILDLDELGPQLPEWLGSAGRAGALPPRLIGYFSHVEEATGTAARAHGIETYPRGRFWRELPRLVRMEKENGDST